MTGNFGNAKQELHQLVDRLPADQVSSALRYMNFLCADPVLLSLLNAPADDEPYTDEQRGRDAQAAASIEAGDGLSHEEVFREFAI